MLFSEAVSAARLPTVHNRRFKQNRVWQQARIIPAACSSFNIVVMRYMPVCRPVNSR
jgi:hypothetical protein